MYKVTKYISFCYGHRLLNYDGKCANLHGHSAKAGITFSGAQLDALGILYDFNEINALVKTWIDQYLDHNMLLQKGDPLIDILHQAGERYYVTQKNPTAEHIAWMIFSYIKKAGYPVTEVSIWETDSCCASYSEEV